MPGPIPPAAHFDPDAVRAKYLAERDRRLVADRFRRGHAFICGDAAQAREMAERRTHLPDNAFLSPPSFLVGQRRRSSYDDAAIRFATQLN